MRAGPAGCRHVGHTMKTPGGLTRGERAPDMVLPAADGTPTRYYALAGGRPALLVLADDASGARLHALAEGLGPVADGRLSVHVVGPAALSEVDVPFPTLTDGEGRAAAAYRTGGIPTAFLLDPNLRVREALAFSDGTAVAQRVVELVDELTTDDRPPRIIVTQAPLLVVPDVLEPDRCDELMAVWEREGNAETGVESSAGGRRAQEMSGQLKRRRDHIVADPERTRDLATTIGRRVMPELSKASGVRVPGQPLRGLQDRLLRSLRSGLLPRAPRQPQPGHRPPPVRAHPQPQRRLRRRPAPLPRVRTGPVSARPGRGAAVQLLHLHEVLDVTAGRRFVLLSFLFGDEARRPG